MASVMLWKDVLHPGTVVDRHGRRFTFTRRDTLQALRNGLRMLSKGLHLPCVWEHQPDAGPVHLSAADRLAAYAKHTFGHVRAFKRDAAGVLYAQHEVYDPKDAAQLRRTRFVSPKVYPSSYRDQTGETYRGATLAHVAATPSPVQFWQRPFELSRAGTLYLSFTPEGTVADETETPAGEGKPAGGDLAGLIDALRSKGMTIPDEVTDIPGLIIAIKAGAGPAADGDDGLGDDPAPEATAPAPGGGPMLMSTTQAEPFVRMTRAGLRARAVELFQTGRIDRPTARKLRQEADAVDLSFTTAGEMRPCPLEARIAAFETLPKNQVWSQDHRGRAGALELSTTELPAAPVVTDAEKEQMRVVAEQERLARQHSAK